MLMRSLPNLFFFILSILALFQNTVYAQDDRVVSPFGCPFPENYASYYDKYYNGTYELIDKIYIDTMDVHPDGDRLAISSQAGVYIFDALTMEFRTTALCSTSAVQNTLVRWSPDGTMLAAFVSGIQGVAILDAETYVLLDVIQPGSVVQSETNAPYFEPGGYYRLADIAWSPDSQQLALIPNGGDGTTGLRVWDVPMKYLILQAQMHRPYSRFYPVSRTLGWSPDGQFFACQCVDPGSTEQGVYIWDATTFTRYVHPPLEYGPPDSQRYSIDWSINNQLAFGVMINNDDYHYLYLWNHISRSGERTNYRVGAAMDWHPDGDRLLISTYVEDESVYAILDTRTQTILQTFPLDQLTTTAALLWHPDGQHFYSVEHSRVPEDFSNSRILRLWHVDSQEPLLTFGRSSTDRS